ncbi:M23 family metallopeptidase [Zhouia sp. PK063]|uniref:M23 family metallopeptidase n=1 Tax=Zhouia sp. PK063 TaxID=3373602 RepID=UPI0037959A83
MFKRFMIGAIAICAAVACKNEEQKEEKAVETVKTVKPAPLKEFGFNLNNYVVKRDTVRQGDSFGEIMSRNNLDYAKVFEISEKARDTFDIRKLQIGKPYTILCKKDATKSPVSFIYQPNSIDYVVIDFADSVKAYTNKKKVTIKEREASGEIEHSLSQAVADGGLDYNIVYKLSAIYAWNIDFFHLQKGDRFKVIYEEKYIDDTIYAGIGRIKAAYFEHKDQPFYAFRYKTDTVHNTYDFYDDQAKTLRRAFLKAPVKYTRISSRYQPRRYHPVLKRWKAHKGTDFAAPTGTPIVATASGTVIKSSYTAGNGNYVKIKHNSKYTTQYLHMSKRIAKVGQYVKQGQVIGLVGMTGLATGPHVCYRFWVNGVQVDPFKQDLPSADPIKPELKEQYLEFIHPLKDQLDNIIFKSEQKQLVSELN